MLYAINDYSVDAEDKGWGPGWPTPRDTDMARIETEETGVRVNVHRRIAKLVKLLMDADERLDGYRYRQADTGGYVSRPIAGTQTPSNHSWGLAVDGNWGSNPVTYDGRAHTDYTPAMLARWRKYGFAWGGDYRGDYRDAMHHEFMGAPSDADAMTAAAVRDLGDSMPSAADVWAAPIKNPDTGMVLKASDRLLDTERRILATQTAVGAMAKTLAGMAAAQAATAAAVKALTETTAAGVDYDRLTEIVDAAAARAVAGLDITFVPPADAVPAAS